MDFSCHEETKWSSVRLWKETGVEMQTQPNDGKEIWVSQLDCVLGPSLGQSTHLHVLVELMNLKKVPDGHKPLASRVFKQHSLIEFVRKNLWIINRLS
jgi:hypothetical protein